jgi:hypothetical protein
VVQRCRRSHPDRGWTPLSRRQGALLVDDLNTMLSDAAAVSMRDNVPAWLDAHQLQIRLFNP